MGSGARIAGGSHATDDVAAGSRLVGTPARPIRQWLKEQAVLKKLATNSAGQAGEIEE